MHHQCVCAKSLQSCPTLWDPMDWYHGYINENKRLGCKRKISNSECSNILCVYHPFISQDFHIHYLRLFPTSVCEIIIIIISHLSLSKKQKWWFLVISRNGGFRAQEPWVREWPLTPLSDHCSPFYHTKSTLYMLWFSNADMNYILWKVVFLF